MPPAHQRIEITGSLLQSEGGGSEIFSFSMASDSGMTPQDLATACAPVVRTFWQADSNAGIPVTAVVSGVRVEQVAVDGKITSSYFVAIPPTPGLAPNTICTVLSSAITLETDSLGSHGRNIRGRFYPPASFGVVGSTTVGSTAQNYGDEWVGLVNGLNDAGANVCVASTENGGTIAPVTAITVDTVIDTVRRRKNHVTSTRTGRIALG